MADAPKLPMMDADTYTATLEKLLGQGKGYGKTTNVGAYLLPNLVIVTETESGKGEVKKEITVEKFYVVMDLNQYKSEDVRKAVIKNIARHWGDKTLGEEDLNSPDFKGPGLWTLKKGSFETDYLAETDGVKNGLWKPNPEAFRVTLQTDRDVNIPFMWDPNGFFIENGGTLAIREKDVKALAGALLEIRDGLKTAEQALYATDKNGATIAAYDIYGMNPGFLQDNYNPVALKPETTAICRAFDPDTQVSGTRAAAPKPA